MRFWRIAQASRRALSATRMDYEAGRGQNCVSSGSFRPALRLEISERVRRESPVLNDTAARVAAASPTRLSGRVIFFQMWNA